MSHAITHAVSMYHIQSHARIARIHEHSKAFKSIQKHSKAFKSIQKQSLLLSPPPPPPPSSCCSRGSLEGAGAGAGAAAATGKGSIVSSMHPCIHASTNAITHDNP
jgi:hypothetical protein